MNPDFFHPLLQAVGLPALMSYDVMLTLSFVMGYLLLFLGARRMGLPWWKVWLALVPGVLLSLIGAKIFHVLFDGQLERYLGIWRREGFVMFARYALSPTRGGMVFYGGLLGACLGGGLGCLVAFRKQPGQVWRCFDLCALPTLLGLGLTRIGCFLNGCCYGIESERWGVGFPPGSFAYREHLKAHLLEPGSASTQPLVPTQLWESGLAFGLFTVFAWRFFRRPPARPGTFFLAAMSAYATGRFVLEFLRRDPRGEALWLSTSQWISLAVIVLAAAVLTVTRQGSRMLKRSADKEGGP